MRIYFARHGESEANLLREFSNRGTKHGLTERGREQMVSLAAKLAELRVTRLFVSPLLRARQSADLMSRALGVTPEVTAELREWDVGVLEGRRDDEAWDRYWRLRAEWGRGNRDARIEGGESLADIEGRFVPFVRSLVASGAPHDRILLLSHGGLLAAALPLVLDNVDAHFAENNALDNAAFVAAERRDQVLFCVQWGESTAF